MSLTLLFLSKDLFFWPIVQTAALRTGCRAQLLAGMADSKLEAVDKGQVLCCLVDLASLGETSIEEATSRLRDKLGQVRIVAYGAHVQQERLQAAAAAGCAPVLTRGQVNAKLSDYLSSWIAEAEGRPST